MMSSRAIIYWLTYSAICLFLMVQGCSSQDDGPVSIATKFAPDEAATYKVVTKSTQGVKWEGSIPDKPAFKGGINSNEVEIVFDQQIQKVDAQGNAVAKITVKKLKYFSKVKDNVIIDVDSSGEQNENNSISNLIGQSYLIEFSPVGKINKIMDIEQIQSAARKSRVVNKTALSELFSVDVVKRRHGLLALPEEKQKTLQKGDSWSSLQNFSFGMMGSKTYERVYTFKDTRKTKDIQTGIFQMKGIPSTEMTEQLYKERNTPDLSKGFDSSSTYSGELEMDLESGKVLKYVERLDSKWISGQLAVKQEQDKEPVALTMSATRFYSLEMVD
jgi:hypothetical protein